MKLIRILHIFVLAASLSLSVSCKKGIPEISTLRELEGFSVDQNLISVSEKISPTFFLSGQCLSQYKDVEVSVDGGQTWLALAELSTISKVDCSQTGAFSAQVSLSKKPLDLAAWSAQGLFTSVQVRGHSDFGFSSVQKVYLNHERAGLGRIVTGASPSALTGGSFKLKGQVVGMAATETLSGGNFKLQGEVLW